MKRTEWSGYYDNTGSRICKGDIVIDQNKRYFVCEKRGEKWYFQDLNDNIAFGDLDPIVVQNSLQIVVFENEEE